MAMMYAHVVAIEDFIHDPELWDPIAPTLPLTPNYPWPSTTMERKSQLALDQRRANSSILSRKPRDTATSSSGGPGEKLFPKSQASVLSFRQKYQAQLHAVLRHQKGRSLAH